MTIKKIVFSLFLVCVGIVVLIFAGFFVYFQFFYEREMKAIRKKINQIENAEVINIWGHEDITLEEIAARVKIKNKGEIVLRGLDEVAFNYPQRISVSEIDGLSFRTFSCSGSIGVGSGIDIGKNGLIGKMIGIDFKSVKDVIDHYDTIVSVIRNLKMSPEMNYFIDQDIERYLLIEERKKMDQDPIFNLLGVEDEFEFARKLEWKNPKCAEY